ncbi:MAG: SoxR reducing system RseC family protein [Candidatus Methanofastidiosa archaeon]|jgi:hypothetical protein|nr:SoxR reducing system RseC family protein [Candidatus Methanofastidiosa archaeon]
MMPDILTLKDIFGLLVVFGFELFFFFQGIKYYKTGEIVEGFRSQDMFGKKSESYDSSIAFGFPFFGIILFIFLNIMLLGALVARSIIGIILFSIHDLGLYLILRWYWKKRTIEANQIGEAES